MLAVDRQDAAPLPAPGGEREVACRDEALLVGERQVDPGLERGERGRRPAKPTTAFRTTSGCRGVDETVEGRLACNRDVGDAARGCDPSRLLPTGSGGDGAQLELGMGVDDLERLSADRARGAEKATFHTQSWGRPGYDGRAVRGARRAPRGARSALFRPSGLRLERDLAERREEVERGGRGDQQAVRPVPDAAVPGQQPPESLIPASRLTSDCMRSPIAAAITIERPRTSDCQPSANSAL